MTAEIPDKWLKAAVIGSIWAAFEIIVGSFLHNLRIPFAGMFLAAASVFLLIAFMQRWNEKGIIIRAGIICALMKSISPSAIILGPMLGIFMEALLIEVFVWLIGRNLIGYLIAGAIAVIWTLLQKILNLLLLYGFDLILIAEAFYQYLARQIPFVASNASYIVIIIFVGYALIGGSAAYLGYRASRRYPYNKQLKTTSISTAQSRENPFYGIDPSQQYSFLNLTLVIVAVVANLYLINRGLYWLACAFGISFMIFCGLRYKRALRYLKKPIIWIQFLIVTLIASIFWEYLSTGKYFSTEGLRIGLEMNFRALVVIFGFSAISVELRNPLIKMLLFRNGFSQLYGALNLAFSALPAMIDHLPGPKNLFRQKQSLIENILAQAEQLLQQFEKKSKGPMIFIITGDVHEGKTSYVEKLITKLKENQLQLAGFLAKGSFNQDVRDAYKLLNLSTNESIALASIHENPGWIRFRRFWFNPQAFNEGHRILEQAAGLRNGLIVVDEVGPMELDQKGWHASLLKLTSISQSVQLWVVRRNLVEEVSQAYRLKPAMLIDIFTTDVEESIEMIVSNMSQ